MQLYYVQFPMHFAHKMGVIYFYGNKAYPFLK